MTKVKLFMLALVCSAFCQNAFTQSNFNNCSAAFLDQKMIVNAYTDTGHCELAKEATGDLTVCTANISPEKTLPVDRIPFMIAIRDKNTKTLCMYSSKSYKSIDISKVLAKCKQGDSIVLMTLDDEYALPHNEILVSYGRKSR